MPTIQELQAQLDTMNNQANELIEKKKGLEMELQKQITQRKPAMPVVGNRSDSDEQRCLRAFGCSHVKELATVNTGLERFRRVPMEYKQMVMELKNQIDTARIVAQIFHGAKRDQPTGNDFVVSHIKNLLDTRVGKDLDMRLKAFSTGSATAGGNWVPTLMAQTFIEDYQLAYLVEDKFTNVPMPSNPFDYPIQTSVTKARKIAENTTITDTTFGTGKITFTAVKIGEYYKLSTEITEDTAPDMIALARKELVDAQRRAVETAILNGDSTSPHIDSDTNAAAADVAEKLWNGLRVRALGNSANGGTTDFGGAIVSESLLRQQRQDMKKFGVNSADLMYIAGPSVYQQLMNLQNVATVEKFGPQATVLRGALAAYQGVPIITSEFMREDLNASGVYDGTTTTMGGLLLVNMRRFWTGTRRGIEMRLAQSLPGDDQLLMASYQRRDFQGVVQSATEQSVNYAYDILVG